MNMDSFYNAVREENLKRYGDDLEYKELFLSRIYSDKFHFIFELLQNAEDANAKNIYFELSNSELRVFHNGTRIFSEVDVKSITKIAKSTKNEQTQSTIGKFGIGFKSVYVITDEPQIYSKDFNFSIKDYILPYEMTPILFSNKYTTLFVLPFKEEEQNENFKIIAERLKSLNAKTLLFLNSIENIKYKICGDIDEEGEYIREKRNTDNLLTRVDVIGQKGNESEGESLYVFRKESVDKKEKVEIAFLIDEKQNKIIPFSSSEDTKLVVYFPTEKETKLGFILNGNFRTTPTRENVYDDDIHNKQLITLAADLLEVAFEKIKEAGLCNVSFLKTLPIKYDDFNSNMFTPLFERVKQILLGKEYLPTVNGKFTNAKKAVISRASELYELYKPEDKHWLTSGITMDKTPDLYSYLQKQLEVEVYTPEKFAGKINVEFLKSQTDEWFVKFYNFLIGQEALWRGGNSWQKEGVLYKKPIIRIENNELRTKEEAFLPVKNSSTNDYPTVKSSIIKDKDALDFLKRFGLREPDIADYITKVILSKYCKTPNPTDAEYDKDLKDILSGLRADSSDTQKRLSDEISKIPIIKCEDGAFRKACEVYQSSALLKNYFQFSKDVYFERTNLNEEDLDLLKVNKLPRMLLCYLPPKEGWKLDRHFYDGAYEHNYELHGLNEFLNNATVENVELLSEIIYKLYDENRMLFKAQQRYFYRTWREETFFNKIADLLFDSEWVLGKDGNLHKPSDITKGEISAEVKNYISELPLPFKEDQRKKFEEELEREGKMVVNEAEFKEFQEYKRLKEEENKSKKVKLEAIESSWTPSCNVANAHITKGMLASIPNDRGKLATISGSVVGKNTDNENTDSGNSDSESDAMQDGKIDDDKNKAIGDWGQDAVERYLIEEEKFDETCIKSLNNGVEIGAGADFEVYKKDGTIEKIIEVKSTQLSDKKFTISGKQWETARKEDDKYWIYAVFGVGTEDVKIVPIQNPIKKWKNGELEAHPVNFIVRQVK